MIIRGPFNLKWGDDILAEIETVEIEHELNSDDYEANSGHVYQIDKSRKVSARLTFLATDIASLAVVLPQYYVPQGGILSSGEPVNASGGAIDVVPHPCAPEVLNKDLDIIACGLQAESIRIKKCRTELEQIEVGKVRKIVVKFIGEPLPNEAAIQLTGSGEIDTEDLFLLDDFDNFAFDDGELQALE